MTLGELLELDVVKAGDPFVHCGGEKLSAIVRWVHVSELLELAGTLNGGELVLSTGALLLAHDVDYRAYFAALADAGAIGLIVEAGQGKSSLPIDLVRAAREREFPLIEFRRTVRFVSITETVHARILNEQFERLEFSQRVHETFASLSVEGAAIDEVLEQTRLLCGYPVVLEDLAHRALSYSSESSLSDLLRQWEVRSRMAPWSAVTAVVGPEGWMITLVGPKEQRWGRLVVPVRLSEDTDRVAMALERAAETLTISQRVRRDADTVARGAQSGLLQDLLRGRTVDESVLRARARALGLAVESQFVAIVLQLDSPVGSPGLGGIDILEIVEKHAALFRASCIVGSLDESQIGVILSSRRDQDSARSVDTFAAAIRDGLSQHGADAGVTFGTAAPVATLGALGSGLSEAAHVAAVAAMFPHRDAAVVYRSLQLGVRGLLWWLRSDPRLLAFVEAQLAPLLESKIKNDDGALELLRTYLDAAGNMSDVAKTLHLSRSGAYARLERLQGLLGVDLADPEARLSLHLALIAHNQ